MSPEQSKKPNIREVLSSRLEKPRSTADLLRTTKQVLKLNPGYAKEAPLSAALHLDWTSFQHNENSYLTRIDRVVEEKEADGVKVKTIKETLLIYRNLPELQAEGLRIETDGLNSEQKWNGEKWVDEEVGGPQFSGVSYWIDQDFAGEKVVDEKRDETAYIATRQPPLIGKKALPHAQRILRELLAEEKKDKRSPKHQ